MKKFEPRGINFQTGTAYDRRQGLLTDTGKARRWNDKLVGFILGILIIFLANWLIGCSTTVRESAPSTFPAPDCLSFAWDERCKVYLPEPEIEYDDAETEIGLEDNF